jgi:hypothetical protein
MSSIGIGGISGSAPSGLSASIGGMQKAMQQNAERADRISKATLDESQGGGDITQDMAEMHLDPAMMKANAAAVKSHDAMLGALLDIFA